MADQESNPTEGSHPDLTDQVYCPSWYPDGRRLTLVDYGGGEGGVLKLVDLHVALISVSDRIARYGGSDQ